MATRPQPNLSKEMAADGSVKSTNGIVYSMEISTIGATAGDIVVIRDGGATGTVKFKFRIPAATGHYPVNCGKYGIGCNSSIYYSELAAAAGKIFATINYD